MRSAQASQRFRAGPAGNSVRIVLRRASNASVSATTARIPRRERAGNGELPTRLSRNEAQVARHFCRFDLLQRPGYLGHQGRRVRI
jgi:hypothetical protein